MEEEEEKDDEEVVVMVEVAVMGTAEVKEELMEQTAYTTTAPISSIRAGAHWYSWTTS